VTHLRVVGTRGREDALAALSDGLVIAVPGDGGYALAVGLRRHDAVSALHAIMPSPADGSPAQVVVGRRAQAIELASEWSDETRHLTDRMWPGPLAVVVATRHDVLTGDGAASIVQISMPASHFMRGLVRESGSLVVAPLHGSDGCPIVGFDEVHSMCTRFDVALAVNGGPSRGDGPTVVDCTVVPPAVCRVGALPESFVDAAVMMGAQRKGFFRWRAPRPPGRTATAG
jgi:tRNA A37 threonylcarbamoyladenosine synthetase subunit TsaC/SUA5/YrdC